MNGDTRRVVIVADDLTGALDAAAPFAKQGFVTRVVALEGASADALRGAQVIAINTESRHLSGPAAAASVDAALRCYALPGDILFKKVDSTLRGNVAAETLAAMAASGRRIAIVAPAFPAQGRTTRAGVVFVRGVPLHDTEFVRDALSPAPRAALAEVLREASPRSAVRNCTPTEFAASMGDAVGDQAHIVVVDAEAQHELDAIVAAARARLSDCLLVGSAGLSTALVVALASNAQPQPRASSRGATIFVVGSRSARSRAQAARLAAASSTVTLQAPDGECADAALRAALDALNPRGSLMLLATQASERRVVAAELVAHRLAVACLNALHHADISAIIATGGDTAKAILQYAQAPVVDVADELMPGIALARFRYNSKEYDFVTKAGGFGEDDTFNSIRELLIG